MSNVIHKLPSDDRWFFARETIETLHRHGFEAYLVGGVVRDILLGLGPKDYDIAASAKPEQLLELFPQADKTGYHFGVLHILKGKHEVQVASFREDSPESDGRRPDEVTFSDLQGDAKRRDFTINAIYFDPVGMKTTDPHDGISDLNNRILRFIGDPWQRIKEDHLRILRAVRFASRFDLTIEAASYEAITALANLAKLISPDRLRDELTKSFTEGNPISCLEILHNTKIIPILWDIFFREEDLFQQIKDSFENVSSFDSVSAWKAFFRPWKRLDNWKNEIENAMRRLNFPRKLKKMIYSELQDC
ncbi:MAG: CCA tRNA nucleotidyltransferase [FCB group bacterium]|nr:CCA tRNA nucleotidyltransferase [FCB group bacterium]